MKSTTCKAAFTLIELLVVIGIISVLISILLPAISKARDSSKKLVCLSNLKQIGNACIMYANSNKGRVPPRLNNYSTPLKTGWDIHYTFGPGAGFKTPSTAPGAFGPSLLIAAGPKGNGLPYMPNNDAFFCPSDDVRAPFRDKVTGWGPANFDGTGVASMSYWEWCLPKRHWDRSTGVQLASDPAIANDRIESQNAAQKMFWSDQYIPVPPAGSDITKLYKNFHKDGMNVLYLDGHAKFVTGKSLEKYATDNNLAGSLEYANTIIRGANKNY